MNCIASPEPIAARPRIGAGGYPPLAALALFLAAAFLYLPSLKGKFLWDDDLTLTANLLTRPGSLSQIWFSTAEPDYWPVTYTLLWAEWRLFGQSPLGYHITCVLLHAVSSLLVWRVLRQLRAPGAWFAALLFALHPVNVEAVAWITQTKTLLASVFGFGCMLAYLRFEDTGRHSWFVGSILLFGLSLLSKPIFALMPLILVLFTSYRQETLGKQDFIRAVPYFLLGAGASVVNIWFQTERSIQWNVIRDGGFMARLTGAADAYAFYWLKALVPWNLMFIYPRVAPNPLVFGAWLPLIALLLLTAAFSSRFASWGRAPLLAMIYVAFSLFPVLGFFDIFFMRYSFVSDHWQYGAIIAPLALAVGLCAHVTRRLPQPHTVRIIFGVVIVLGLAGLSLSRQRVFRDSESLWRNSASRNPNAWMAHLNLARVLEQQGRLEEASAATEAEVRAFRRLLAEGRDDLVVRFDFGQELQRLGLQQPALEMYESCCERRPGESQFHNYRGTALATLGRNQEAQDAYKRAITLRPDNWEAQANLGFLLRQQGDLKGAISALRKAVTLKPTTIQGRLALADILSQAGHTQEADYWRKNVESLLRE